MKKLRSVLALLMALMLLVSAVGCGSSSSSSEKSTTSTNETVSNETTTEEVEETWKIGIMTSSVSQGEEQWRAAERIIEQYGSDRVILQAFPDNFTTEQETTISTALSIVSDPDVKVMIFGKSLIGTTAACQKIREVRPDVVIIAGSFNEAAASMSEYCDVFYREDMPAMGKQIVEIAKQAGCGTIVHYSFPRHLANANMAQRLQIIKDLSAKAGIKVVEVSTPDPSSDAGTAGTQQFVLEDVPREIEKYGSNTMFFGTNTAQLEPMIKACAQGKAYYYPSVQSVFTGYTGALGLSIPNDHKFDAEYYVEEIKKKLAEAGCEGHMGAWVVPFEAFELDGAMNYAVKYCKGETNGVKFDPEIFKKALSEAANGKEPTFSNVTEGETTYDNGLFIALPYEVF